MFDVERPMPLFSTGIQGAVPTFVMAQYVVSRDNRFLINQPAPESGTTEVNVKTPDGTADCYFVHPSSGTAPGFSSGPTSLGCVRHFVKWANGSPNRAIPCSW
jgi:hypothetical protein